MFRIFAIFGFVFLIAGAPPAWAGDYKLGSLTISHPWARATPVRAKTGAAYITITNNGAQVDRLIKAATTAAKKASLHTHTMDGDIMRMRPISGVEISPGEPTAMKPGGLHLMLMGLKAPLREGAEFPLILTFEKAGVIEVSVRIKKIGSMGPEAHGHKRHGS